jgi:hypothetical protein
MALLLIPPRTIYTPAPYVVSNGIRCPPARNAAGPDEAGILPGMTLMEMKYAFASPLTLEQLRELSQFANVYGLRKFRLNDAKTELSFEYDASRLRETELEHVLRQAKIAVAKRLN